MQQITLDDRTYELAQALATRRRESLQSTISNAVSEAARRAGLEEPCSVVGAMSHEADFLDELVEDAMRQRESRVLRRFESV